MGKKVARTGWNGSGMWLKYEEASSLGGSYGEPRSMMLPFIKMKVAGHSVEYGEECIDFVPWLASQTDILAEDWLIVE